MQRSSTVEQSVGAVAHIGHVELLTAKFQESLGFFTEILGLDVTEQNGPSAYLRGYGDYEEVGLKLTAADEPGLGHAAFRTRSEEALRRCVESLEASGLGQGWIDGDVGHGRAYRFRDPGGHTFEVYFETRRRQVMDGLPKNRPGRRGNGAIDVSRVDHINVFSHDVASDRAFAEKHLGVRTLDIVLNEVGREVSAFTNFSNKPLDIAYSIDLAPRAGRLHHVAFWAESREEVLHAADVFLENGVPIEVPPGLHTIGKTFFLYGFEPGGNRIEVATGAALELDPDPEPRVWTAEEMRAGVGWGTKYPDSWRTYGTPPSEGGSHERS